jgi:hypothetical protein
MKWESLNDWVELDQEWAGNKNLKGVWFYFPDSKQVISDILLTGLETFVNVTKPI